jgi:Domain of unknown function (DUF4440)
MNEVIVRVRKLTVALLLAIAFLSVGSRSLIAQQADVTAEAQKALSAVFDALSSGDPNKVRPLLAAEFQVVRSNGAAYDKEQYLAQSIPKIEGRISFDDLVVTRNADIVVTRMRLKIRERIDGKLAESGAPQLIVFRVTPRGWQVVAAANFAKLTE